MRVLHLLKTSTGATWALRQIGQLVKLGLEIHVALPPGPLVDSYVTAGATVHPIQFDFPLRKPWKLAAMSKRLRTLVLEIQPSVIHSHFVGTTLTARLALGRNHCVPRVFQVPGPLHLEHTFFRRAELLTAGPPDSWIGSCRWSCQRYVDSGVSPDRVFLSYYGADLEQFRTSRKGKLRNELGLNGETRIVGMVAFMYAPKKYLGQRRGLKGHEDLIDSIAICLEKRKDLVCVFVGGAWNGAFEYERSVRLYARQRIGDRAIFLGNRNDVADLYPDFNVVAHPSHSENVGGAAESLLLAVPTIASDTGGLPDLVRHNETGWLVPPRSPERLAEAIFEALREPQRAAAMATRGQELARELFDVRRNARQVSEIYRTVVAARAETRLTNPGFEPRNASVQ